jgi:hypothetical protein
LSLVCKVGHCADLFLPGNPPQRWWVKGLILVATGEHNDFDRIKKRMIKMKAVSIMP